MVFVVDQIENNQVLNKDESVVVNGNVGKNCRISIKNGSLHVKGNIDDNVSIDIKTSTNSNNKFNMSNGVYIQNFNSSNNNNNNVSVDGRIGHNVTIFSPSSSIKARNIGCNCLLKSHNGDIKVDNIDINSVLETHNGDIKCNDIGNNCKLKSYNGDIKYNNTGTSCILHSYNGDVKVNYADDNSKLETYNGSIKTQFKNNNVTIKKGNKLNTSNGIYQGAINSIINNDRQDNSFYTDTSNINNIFNSFSTDMSNFNNIFNSFSTDMLSSLKTNFNLPAVTTNTINQSSQSRPNGIISNSVSNVSTSNSVSNVSTSNSLANNNNDDYTKAMKRYIDTFKDKKKNSEWFVELGIESDEFYDPLLFEVMDIPVRLDGKVYDLNSILKLPLNNGKRQNPFTKDEFTLIELQPAWDIQDKIRALIDSSSSGC